LKIFFWRKKGFLPGFAFLLGSAHKVAGFGVRDCYELLFAVPSK